MKRIIVAAVVALAVVGGGIFWAVSREGGGKSPEIPASETQSGQTTSQASLKQLMEKGENQRCTFEYADEQGSSSATVYFAGKHMRGSFTSAGSGQAPQESNVLQDNEYQYFWIKDAKEGFKAKITDLQSQTAEQQNQGVDQNKQFEFKCSKWTVDETLFTPPSDVVFSDYNAQMQQFQQQLQSNPGACAQITDPAGRAACERAL